MKVGREEADELLSSWEMKKVSTNSVKPKLCIRSVAILYNICIIFS